MRKLKYTLDRKSLEIIYLSFIRPLLEYADIVWDNCTQYEKDAVEKIQIEAARITSGATRLVSIDSLYTEICWETLEHRRHSHKLNIFYKMKNGISPTYLIDIVPPEIDTSRYNFRNSDNVQLVRSRTTLYFNSFLPSTVREWNSLPNDTRNAQSLNCFKTKIKINTGKVPSYYYNGSRYLQVIHTRLRTKCSALNHDLYRKNIVESPNCTCGQVEDANHYFFTCTRYTTNREQLMNDVQILCQPTLHILLYGNTELDPTDNESIFACVRTYIQSTGRFS